MSTHKHKNPRGQSLSNCTNKEQLIDRFLELLNYDDDVGAHIKQLLIRTPDAFIVENQKRYQTFDVILSILNNLGLERLDSGEIYSQIIERHVNIKILIMQCQKLTQIYQTNKKSPRKLTSLLPKQECILNYVCTNKYDKFLCDSALIEMLLQAKSQEDIDNLEKYDKNTLLTINHIFGKDATKALRNPDDQIEQMFKLKTRLTKLSKRILPLSQMVEIVDVVFNTLKKTTHDKQLQNYLSNVLAILENKPNDELEKINIKKFKMLINPQWLSDNIDTIPYIAVVQAL